MIEFISPTLDYALLAPIMIVLGGAVLGVLIEAFAPRKSRASSQLFITLATLVLSLAALIRVRDRSSSAAAMESVTFDGAGMLIQGSILIISIIAVFYLQIKRTSPPWHRRFLAQMKNAHRCNKI